MSKTPTGRPVGRPKKGYVRTPEENKVKNDSRVKTADLPPFPNRTCVRLGMATVAPSGRYVTYNWPKIVRVWYASRSGTLNAFCHEYQIPFQTAERTGFFDRTEKRTAGHLADLRPRRRLLAAITANQLKRKDHESITRILRDIEITANLTASYTKARMVKIKDGRQTPNLNLSTNDVRKLAEINELSARALKNLADVQSDVKTNPVEPFIRPTVRKIAKEMGHIMTDKNGRFATKETEE